MKKFYGLVAIIAVAASIYYTCADGVISTAHDIGPGPTSAPAKLVAVEIGPGPDFSIFIGPGPTASNAIDVGTEPHGISHV